MKTIALLAAFAVAAPANASEQPVLAPAADWVQAVASPAPDPADAEKPYQILLLSNQSRRDADGVEYYIEHATLVQDPQALTALGTVAIPWNPGRGSLTVHKVQIVRAGTVIDLLARQRLTVLRRETNLENATIDGTLTAMLQAEGLAVGDTLSVAFTIRLRDPERIKFRAERFTTLPEQKVGRFFQREVWPSDQPVRWSGKEMFARPQVRETRFGKEISLELRNATLPAIPESAPTRFRLGPGLDLSGYGSWEEISRLVEPVYGEARRTAPGSALRTEIAAIAGSVADPRLRAIAALRLVQDKVRYVALAIGDGGYVPAGADETWQRKFGDCKGKTAALLALLDGLGVEAEPVLVSTRIGDALPDRLPMVGLFDHVVVRAQIGGKSFWLDGTGTGDRDIQALASAPFRWGLPLRSSGTGLEEIPAAPASLPTFESEFVFDASGGFQRPVAFTGQLRYRGAEAASQAAAFAQIGREAVRERLREAGTAKASDFEITGFDFKKDEQAGTFTVSYSGKTRMRWSPAPGSNALRYEFDSDTIEWDIGFERPKGPHADLPFVLPYPLFLTERQTVILPFGGKGFSLEGEAIDESAAGAHIARKLTLEGGRASAVSSFRILKPEIAAAEGRAGAAALKRINAAQAYVRSPADYKPSEAELKAIRQEEPKTASGFVERGYWSMETGAYKSAIADFDKASAMSAEWSRPVANRGVALIHQGKFDEAEGALAKAATLSNEDFVVHQGYGLLHLARDKPAEALSAFTRSLHLDSDNEFTLMHRATAYEQLGQFRQALDDILAALKLKPASVEAIWRAARLHAELGEQDQLTALFDAGFERAPDDFFLRASKGEFLERFGRKSEAAAAFDVAFAMLDKRIENESTGNHAGLIGIKVTILSTAGRHREAVAAATAGLRRHVDHIDLLAERCSARAVGNFELDRAMADCKLAAELDPERVTTAQARGLVELRRQDWDAAIAVYSAALGWEPNDPRCLYGRALARSRKGDTAGAEKDFALARRYGFDTAAEFDMIGLRR